MRNVRTHPKERSSLCPARGCCLLEGAAGEEGLDGPAQPSAGFALLTMQGLQRAQMSRTQE